MPHSGLPPSGRPVISGSFSEDGPVRRPYLRCRIELPAGYPASSEEFEFLVDTGADVTTLSPDDAVKIGLDISSLDFGRTSRGVGGAVTTRVIESNLLVQGYSVPLTLQILEFQQPIPSVLGRDFMSHFALFMEERRGLVLFFDQSELAQLGLTVQAVA